MPAPSQPSETRDRDRYVLLRLNESQGIASREDATGVAAATTATVTTVAAAAVVATDTVIVIVTVGTAVRTAVGTAVGTAATIAAMTVAVIAAVGGETSLLLPAERTTKSVWSRNMKYRTR